MIRDHVVLCGLGKVGFSILELLHDLGEQVAVVSRDVRSDWGRRAAKMAAVLINGDGRDEEALREACVEDARAIIIVSNDDVANLEMALDAKRLAPNAAVVVRIYDDKLAQRVSRELDLRAVFHPASIAAPAFVAAALGDDILRAFDVRNAFVHIISVRQDRVGESVQSFAQRHHGVPLAVRSQGEERIPTLDAALRPGDEVILAAASSGLAEVTDSPTEEGRRTSKGSMAAAWSRPRIHPMWLIKQIWLNASPVFRVAFISIHVLLIISVVTFRFALGMTWVDAFYFTVTIMTSVGFGDFNLREAPAILKLFGTAVMVSGVALTAIFFAAIADYVVTQRLEQALGPRKTTLSNHVIVVGLGSLGLTVALRLHAMGVPVLAIEKDVNRELPSPLPAQIPVINGDATQVQTMEMAGIDQARALVSVTNDDLVNLRVAQHAENRRSRIRTVVRLFQSSLANKLAASTFGIDQALNPSQAAAATFVSAALASDVVQGFTLGNRLLMLRWLEGERLNKCVGQTIAELREHGAVHGLLRERGLENPLEVVRPSDRIETSDRLVVLEEYRPSDRSTILTRLLAVDEPAREDG